MTTRFSGKWHASPSFRASIILPFIVISVALGVLAWRSYQLSVRMEKGLHALSIQYLDYAAEITARRVDSLARTEMFNASDDWQQTERTPNGPDFAALRGWVSRHPWIATAIYIPDMDPEEALYVAEGRRHDKPTDHPKNEFYTASGTVRYSYDPQLLLAFARSTLKTDVLLKSAHTDETLRKESEIQFIPTPKQTGLSENARGLSVIVPLSEPLEKYSVIASVQTSYIASGWANHRVISLWLAAISVLLVAFGAAFAIRGLEREAEAMQLRSALIANVSHELRTPLSMIRLAAETLKRGATKLTEAEKNDLQQSILREVLHLSHLVENVLDVARLQKNVNAPVFRPVAPPELVRSVVASYEPWISSKGFTIALDIDSSVPEQMWDREALSRALVNLIDNAMKYSGSESWLRVSLGERDDHVAISVEDRGIGIPDDDLQKIFEPYYRSGFSDTETRRGAGLGLTLVNQIVQRHGGRIDVQSTVGLGSTFTILLPKQQKVVEPLSVEALETSKA